MPFNAGKTHADAIAKASYYHARAKEFKRDSNRLTKRIAELESENAGLKSRRDESRAAPASEPEPSEAEVPPEADDTPEFNGRIA